MSKVRILKEIQTATAYDKEGNEHHVIVYGEVEITRPYKEITAEYEDVKISYTRKTLKKVMTLSYAICHPDDIFDPKIGEEIAKRRIKTDPLGTAYTDCPTMFQKEDLEAAVTAKLSYIVTNIEEYMRCKHGNKKVKKIKKHLLDGNN